MQRTDITTAVVIATSLLVGFGAGYSYQPPIVFNGGLTVSALDNFDGHGARFIQSKPITISGSAQPAYKAGDMADGGAPDYCKRPIKHTTVSFSEKPISSSEQLEKEGFCKGDTITFVTQIGSAVRFTAKADNATFILENVDTAVIGKLITLTSNTQPKK